MLVMSYEQDILSLVLFMLFLKLLLHWMLFFSSNSSTQFDFASVINILHLHHGYKSRFILFHVLVLTNSVRIDYQCKYVVSNHGLVTHTHTVGSINLHQAILSSELGISVLSVSYSNDGRRAA